MTSVRVIGPLDDSFAWDGERLYGTAGLGSVADVPRALRGSAASVALVGPGVWRIVRDALGINKVFWAHEDDGGVALAARPTRLIERGHELDTIHAVPRASVFVLSSDRGGTSVDPLEAPRRVATSKSLTEIAEKIRETLDQYLAALAAAYPEAQFFVCLSGGLDSSGIAALAREHCPGLVAVSFDLERGHGRSEDRTAAERLSRDLALPLMCVTSSPDAVLEKLDLVLTEGIDWRDFNVHAGLVNAALAEAIAARESGEATRIVLTGDLANEFLADYGPEEYGGTTYYELPRLPGSALRDALVRGLDSSNREIGVFSAWGLGVVQPYAVAVDSYLALPSEIIGPDGKRLLSEAIFGSLLPGYVYSRPKVRAQVGSSSGDSGILGLCAERGVDSAYLRERFAFLHHAAEAALARFIRGGTYRSSAPTLRLGEAT